MDLAPPSALRWFSIAVQSIPSYLGSLMAPNSVVVRTEALAITRIINIPHQAIPIYTLATLNGINIPIKINAIWYQSLAARCRVYMKSALLPRLLGVLLPLAPVPVLLGGVPVGGGRDGHLAHLLGQEAGCGGHHR
jgi:hypothetical protein